jgi:glycerate kinase
MKAQPVRGVDMVLDALHFENMIEGCNYVITGEGRMDKQTVMGKAPGGVLRIAQKHGIPTIAVCGIVDDCIELQQSGFAHIVATKPPQMPIETAMQPDIAIQNIIYTSQQIAEMIQARNNLI